MRTAAILPIKSFGDSKQRLAESLSPPTRRALAESMFCDVLVALRRCPELDSILVITGDPTAQGLALSQGARVLSDADAGHNPAARRGVQSAVAQGAQRVLLVPGDCPLLAAEELTQILQRPVSHPSALVVPDRHGTGTNALLLTPPDALAPSFGPESCARHLSQATDAQITAETVQVPGLALDVDTAEDLDALTGALDTSHGGAARTRGLLAQLARAAS